MEKGKLTLKKLKEMKIHTIFRFEPGETMGRTFMWVAKKGGTLDWAIYTSLNFVLGRDFWAGDKKGIADHGQKVHSEEEIKRLVPCDDEVFKMYRH